jgi:aromatic ring hydroxylase
MSIFTHVTVGTNDLNKLRAWTRDWADNAYAAYARDPDGNKLAVYCFKAA